MPDIDDLEVIRELLTGKPPAQDVNDYVKGRLNAVMAAAESHPGAGRPVCRTPSSHRTVAGAARRAQAAGAGARRPGWRSAGRGRRGRGGRRGAASHAAANGGPAVLAAYVVKRVSQRAERGRTRRYRADDGRHPRRRHVRRQEPDDHRRGMVQRRPVAPGDMNSPDGRPLYDEGFGTSSLYTLVSYQARTWARQHGLSLGPSGVPVLPGPPGCKLDAWPGPPPGCCSQYGLPGTRSTSSSLPSTVARDLRAAVSCGALVDGGQTARGRHRGNRAEEPPRQPGLRRPSGSARARTCRCASSSA